MANKEKAEVQEKEINLFIELHLMILENRLKD